MDQASTMVKFRLIVSMHTYTYTGASSGNKSRVHASLESHVGLGKILDLQNSPPVAHGFCVGYLLLSG